MLVFLININNKFLNFAGTIFILAMKTGKRMTKFNPIVIFSICLIIIFTACDKEPTPYDKPKDLIKEKEMISMLVDMHLAESTYNAYRNDSTFQNLTSSVFYYSILDKYQKPDSVFEKSFLYYAGNPRNFEKLYRKVINKISEMEVEYSGRKIDPLEFDPTKVK
jgi:hypothetical protein